MAYSGNLYSVEFFQQCARRLKPGGILCTWAPTPRVYADLHQRLPLHRSGSATAACSSGATSRSRSITTAWRARALSPEVVAYIGEDSAQGTAWLLERVQILHRYRRRHPTRNMNFDLFPRDEFHSPD